MHYHQLASVRAKCEDVRRNANSGGLMPSDPITTPNTDVPRVERWAVVWSNEAMSLCLDEAEALRWVERAKQINSPAYVIHLVELREGDRIVSL